MNKICTSIEQSKKLIELGIDRKTSDMYYWCGEDLRIGGYKAQYEELDIPAWSLAALLSVIPYKLQIALAINDFQGDRKEKYAIGSVEHDRYDCYADNAVDACVELILKLHELNLL